MAPKDRPIPRLILLPDATDAATGEPRAALVMPAAGRRPVIRAFATVAAALLAKRQIEAESGQ